MRRRKTEQAEFVPFGPFTLPRTRRKKIATNKRAEFWRNIETKYPGLSNAVGCYVFAINTSKGTLPWYVGKTMKRPFAREVWAPARISQYQDILRRRKRGTPLMFLAAKRSREGKFARPSERGQMDIDLLEGLLLESALLRNRKLRNPRGTRQLQSITMSGFINGKPGHPTLAAQRLAKTLGSA